MNERTASLKMELAGQTTEMLVRELIGLFGWTAPKLARMAAIVRELESRGYDVSVIRDQFMVRQLRRIAVGDLLPEVVSTLYVAGTAVVDAVARLPIGEQRKLLDRGQVDVLVNDKMEAIDLVKLNRESIAIAFGPDHLRTEAEQRQQLLHRQAVRSPQPESEPNYRVQPVPDRKGIKVGNTFAKVEEIVPALSELAGPLDEINPDAPDVETLTFRVTKEEKARLRAACKRTGKLEWRLIREAVHAYGLI